MRDARSTWETRYALLLWLSILVMVPFDLSTIDSSTVSTSGSGREAGLVAAIMRECRGYLSDAGATRDAAAVCVGRLLTRPDMETRHFQEFVLWARQLVEDYVRTHANIFQARALCARCLRVRS